MTTLHIPTLAEIQATADALAPHVVRTPILEIDGGRLVPDLAGTGLVLKLELFQHTGSFKARGALATMLALGDAERAQGVTAVSAGNHAIAVAWAARQLGVDAKVVMIRTASPVRIERCRRFGAEVILADDAHAAFALVRRIAGEEGRTLVHPFEGARTFLGTASLGREMLLQAGRLDALLIPIGGGGLAAGMAAAVKQMQPDCRVVGIEPEGADSMHRSFAAGSPQAIEQVRTIADSLGAPFALPMGYGLCRRFLDDLVLLDDAAMVRAMRLLHDELKLVTEPAGATATAALLGPLRAQLQGRRVGLIVCGSNIDRAGFDRLLDREG